MRKRPILIVVAIAVLLALIMPVPPGPLDGYFDGRTSAKVLGTIASIKETDHNLCFDLNHVILIWKGRRFPAHKILFYLNKESGRPSQTDWKPGFSMKAEGVLTKFQKPGNPGEFNSYLYYKRKGYDYSFFAESMQIRSRKQNAFTCIQSFLLSFRNRLSGICQAVYPKEQAGLLQEMFLGEKGKAGDESKELYRRNGIGHLICISGLHVSLIGMGIYIVMLRILRHKKAACLFGMAGSVAYGMMTGFEIASSRAVLMLFISFLAVFVGRSYDMISAASLSAVILLCLHPLQIRDSGFLLSFGAVAGIAVIYPVLKECIYGMRIQAGKDVRSKDNTMLDHCGFLMKKAGSVLGDSLLLSASIQLATFPILLSSYYEYPVYSIFLNLLVLPLMSLLASMTMGSCLIGLLSHHAAVFFGGSVSVILSLYERLCHIFDQLPNSHYITGKPPLPYLVFYYGFLIIILMMLHLVKQKRFFFFFLFLIFIPIQQKIKGLKVTMLDVGQGDGIYLETEEGFRALVDGGSSSKEKLGSYVLVPFLKYQGIGCLDAVFLSHLDEDHCNGILELLEDTDSLGIQIRSVYVSQATYEEEAFEPWKQRLKEKQIPCVVWGNGDYMKDSKGKMSIICHYPDIADVGKDRNEESMVFSLLYDGFSMLFTGDIGQKERKAAEQIRMAFERPFHYSVLKVGHHGSKNSSSEEFLEEVSPMYSLISSGVNNRYGHPHKETLERLKACKSQIYQTKVGGAITLYYRNDKLSLEYFRQPDYR